MGKRKSEMIAWNTIMSIESLTEFKVIHMHADTVPGTVAGTTPDTNHTDPTVLQHDSILSQHVCDV